MVVDTDQQQYWNRVHAAGKLEAFAEEPSTFAQEVIAHFPLNARVAELGCGSGADAVFFARQGHIVSALDFSDIAIACNHRRHNDRDNPVFQVADISQPLPFPTGELDVIYARLSLHYFPDYRTKTIFEEIRRVLTPGGLLTFMCKSTADPQYGRGVEVEPDMFAKDGRHRHFFSEDYARSCLGQGYRIEQLASRREALYGTPSAYVLVIARTI